MKISVDIDCSPEEARAFLGLPDVRPLQDSLMREIEARMTANLQAMDPGEMMRQWLPTNLKAFEAMLDAFTRKGG